MDDSEIGKIFSIKEFNKIHPLDRHSAKGVALGPAKYNIKDEIPNTIIEGINWSLRKYHENKRVMKPTAQIPGRKIVDESDSIGLGKRKYVSIIALLSIIIITKLSKLT